jgi:hypothetical protein
MGVFLTYDNRNFQDGLGAQALRITGVFAISRAFGLHYIHSPILSVTEDVGQNLEDENSQTFLIQEFNNFFNFPSSRNPSINSKHLYVKNLSVRILIQIIVNNVFQRGDLIVHVLLPQGVFDKFPRIYQISSRYLRRMNHESLKSVESLALVAHFRRGYDEKYNQVDDAKFRQLPPAYYTHAFKVICEKGLFQPGSRLIIHTDLLNNAKAWKPFNRTVLQNYRKASGKTKSSEIKLEAFDLNDEITVPDGYVLEVRYCHPLMKTFLEMCNANILVQGKSALSILAGIVNPNLVIFAPGQKLSKLPRWKMLPDLE